MPLSQLTAVRLVEFLRRETANRQSAPENHAVLSSTRVCLATFAAFCLFLEQGSLSWNGCGNQVRTNDRWTASAKSRIDGYTRSTPVLVPENQCARPYPIGQSESRRKSMATTKATRTLR